MLKLLETLQHLATERSSDKRLELLRKITDLFFSAEDHQSEAEKYLFSEIIERVVAGISRDAKIEVSTNLATLPGFPRKVVRTFANDVDIEIARPVLRASPELDDDDLREIAMSAGQAHLHAIATRDTLSSSIADILIKRGDRRVVHRVSANHGAHFSSEGFDRLMDKARHDVDLQGLLVERNDLSTSTVDKLLPLVSESLAIRLRERGYGLGSTPPPVVVNLAREHFHEALRTRKANVQSLAAITRLVELGEVSLEEAVEMLAADGRLFDTASLIASLSSLDKNNVFGVIMRGQMQIMMLLFRALDLPWPVVDRILALRSKKMKVPRPPAEEMKPDYLALDRQLAQRAVRFLQVRDHLTRAPAEAG
jgi:uncharacterized protein (DUF2336 family)